MTGDNYLANPEFLYVTFVIGLDPPSLSSKTELFVSPDQVGNYCYNPDPGNKEQNHSVKIKISERKVLMFCNAYLNTRESISVHDHTKIYIHTRYRPQVIELKDKDDKK